MCNLMKNREKLNYVGYLKDSYRLPRVLKLLLNARFNPTAYDLFFISLRNYMHNLTGVSSTQQKRYTRSHGLVTTATCLCLTCLNAQLGRLGIQI